MPLTDWFVQQSFQPSVPLAIALVAVWLAVVGLVAIAVKRFNLGGSETIRKVVHIGTGNVILLAWWLQIPAWVGMVASVLFSVITLLSYRYPILPAINTVGRKSLGTFFYAASIGMLIAWFWTIGQPHYAVIGVLVMTWGDGMAALVGQRFGHHPYTLWGMTKSWEGSLAMGVMSYLVSLLVLWGVQGLTIPTWTVPLAIALVATLLESVSKLGIDNLTVPLGSAAIGFLLNQG
ncbi:MAG: SEC59/DGK1/VTE5 family protein [Synechococcales bacterium]|nr:SEC59/DGK1/VTE5 family protein [Synechococcales bacterium]